MPESPISASLKFGPGSAGVTLSSAEFDAADFERGWRYELIQGVLVVNPAPLPQERGPNDELGFLLNHYQRSDPDGKSLDCTLPEHDVHIGGQRRRADRVVWAGLGRQPRIDEVPAIVIEFVSEGRRNWARDYETKRNEYLAIGVKEYWVMNRFERTLTVFEPGDQERVIRDGEVLATLLLPGFKLPIADLLHAADRWEQ